MPQAPVVVDAPSPLKATIRPHSGIKPPARVVYVAPVYPITARAARKEGLVIIEATIDEQGNVTQTQLLRSIPLLDEAALVAVRQWKFSPTLLNGTPVSIVMTVTVNFKLTQ
jgi:protein TonB